jgi:acyl-CoA synthetase (AMP-forming)/AMP-acid ligase II
MHLGTAFRRLSTWHGARIAFVDAAGPWSFQDIIRRIAKVGRALHGLGLQHGDRVALLLPDIREYVEADYGIMAAGLVRVPMDWRAPRADLIAQLRHAGVRGVVAQFGIADGLRDEVDTLRHIITVGGRQPGTEAYEALLARASDELLPAGTADDLATLNFSGGTTGMPKAIMHRHSALFAVAQNTIAGFGITQDAVFLNVRPLWPIAQVVMLSYFMAGARTVLGGRFVPEAFAALVATSGATRTSLVPTQLVRCLDHIGIEDPLLTRLEAIHVGGSRIPPPVFERTLSLIGPRIGVLYGMTEAPVNCYLPPHMLTGPETARLIHAVGRPLFGYEVQADADTGEVLVRGPNVMAGYWNDPATSNAALRNGWLHTGDIGQFDDSGVLSIIGRIKDVIRTGSQSVVPKEVEDVIAQHPAVLEVAVLGLPDVEWGEVVTAFVVLKPDSHASAADIIVHCQDILAPFKRPKSVRFHPGLPRSHYGKVLRADLLAGVQG